MSDRMTMSLGRPVLASFCAGPLFLLASLPANPPQNTSDVATGINLLLLAAGFGWPVSILPNVAGSWLLHRLGRDNIGFRLPVMWVMVGGCLAGGAAAAADAPPSLVAMFAATGALSAGIARLGAAWLD